MIRNIQKWGFLPVLFFGFYALSSAQTEQPAQLKCKDLPPGAVVIGSAKCVDPKPVVEKKLIKNEKISTAKVSNAKTKGSQNATPNDTPIAKALESDKAKSLEANPATQLADVKVEEVVASEAPVPVVATEEFTGYNVSSNDKTLRDVVGRWAKHSGWTFEPEHWTIAKDVAISAKAVSNLSDFKSAVRWLLKSTVITDLPLQPCFYSNQVVRVILLTESCNRTLITAVKD